jgi:hypothetical protein
MCLAFCHSSQTLQLFTMDGGCIIHNLGSGTGYSARGLSILWHLEQDVFQKKKWETAQTQSERRGNVWKDAGEPDPS